MLNRPPACMPRMHAPARSAPPAALSPTAAAGSTRTALQRAPSGWMRRSSRQVLYFKAHSLCYRDSTCALRNCRRVCIQGAHACTKLQALDEGVTQVVCIAAGYDTRAYRFARQGVKVSAAPAYYPPGRLLSGSQRLLFCARSGVAHCARAGLLRWRAGQAQHFRTRVQVARHVPSHIGSVPAHHQRFNGSPFNVRPAPSLSLCSSLR